MITKYSLEADVLSLNVNLEEKRKISCFDVFYWELGYEPAVFTSALACDHDYPGLVRIQLSQLIKSYTIQTRLPFWRLCRHKFKH